MGLAALATAWNRRKAPELGEMPFLVTDWRHRQDLTPTSHRRGSKRVGAPRLLASHRSRAPGIAGSRMTTCPWHVLPIKAGSGALTPAPSGAHK
jgi:hypothetical protein